MNESPFNRARGQPHIPFVFKEGDVTPFEEKGWDKDTILEVVEESTKARGHIIGWLVKIVKDDGTHNPKFYRVNEFGFEVHGTTNHHISLYKLRPWIRPADVQESNEEYTGGSSSYYVVPIPKPTTPEHGPYVAECNDIIEAHEMNYAEGNAFKAIWRKAAARTLGKKKKGNTALYDAEKVHFFGGRMVEQEKAKSKLLTRSRILVIK